MCREVIERLPIEGVADADLQLFEAVEHVQLGQRHAGDARNRDGLADEHRVEPAAAALAPRYRAEFMAALPQLFAVGIVLFGGEGAAADAGRIRLDDAEHISDRIRPHAAAGRGLAGDDVGRRDERIGAVVDIEQHALRAFEQDAAALGLGIAQGRPHRLDEGQHRWRDLVQLGDQRFAVDRRDAEADAQRVVVGEQPVELRADIVEMGKVADPQRAAAGLVLIRRADAAAGGADRAGAAGIFPRAIEIAVQRQDQRALIGNVQVGGRDRDAHSAYAGHLVTEVPRIENHAIADDRQRSADDTAGQQAQFIDVFADDQGVAGVMAALEAHDDIGALRQPVDDLAFAFITPLGADDGNIGHCLSFVRSDLARL